MRYIFSIVFFLSVVSCFAQNSHLVPLESEKREESINHLNARISASAIDTTRLQLPFFDDFSSIQVPMDLIKNVAGDTVEIFSKGLHGLINTTSIVFYLTVNDSLPSRASTLKNPGNPSKDSLIADINGPFNKKTFYAKVTSPFSFKVFLDDTLQNALLGNGKPFLYGGYWLHPGSKMGNTPNPLKWISGQGAYINNRFGKNPPSVGVATFEGLKSNGVPYNILNLTSQGPCDTLTSRVIDLSKYSAKDSLIFSFYWQGKGYGEAPTNIPGDTDSLWLEFKNNAGKWNWVWGEKGIDSPFKYQSIQFGKLDSTVFHKNFQFRFRSFGNQAGMYDVWNVDYIYLNNNRQNRDTLLGDLALDMPITPILNNYRAMPFTQFSVNKSSRVKTSFTTIVKNNKTGISQNQRRLTVYDPKNSLVFVDTLLSSSPIIGEKYDTISDHPNLKNLDNINASTTIMSKVFIPYSDAHIPGIDLGINNFDSIATDITDYFAYDDGSAETGYNLCCSGSKYNKMVSKFSLDKEDYLQYIQICFPPQTPSQANQQAYLQVIKSLTNNANDDVYYYNQTIKVQYTSGRDNFTTYSINPPVKIEAGDFYVGLEKLTDEGALTIGHDLNTVHDNTFYIKIKRTWTPISKFDAGSFMIRPLFGPSSLTPVEDPTATTLSCDLFPNPSTGLLTIKGAVKNIKVYDLSGRLVTEEKLDSENKSQEINLEELPGGFYLVHLSNDHLSAIKKLLISK